MTSYSLPKILCTITYFLFSIPTYLLAVFFLLAGAFDILTDSIWSIIDEGFKYGIILLISLPFSLFFSYFFRSFRKYHFVCMAIGAISSIIFSILSVKEYLNFENMDYDLGNILIAIVLIFSNALVLVILGFITVFSLLVFMSGLFGFLRLRCICCH
jgi:hypothetical protein